MASTRTVVVLGASYGGARAAHLLAAGLPAGWRIFLIDRNSYDKPCVDVYVLPRFAVLAGHEHKGFIPTDKIFKIPAETAATHTFIQTRVQGLDTHSVKLARAFPEQGIGSDVLHFDYVVYTLGSPLPNPLNLWDATPDGKPRQDEYRGRKAEAIAGGALGIQFATDIAAVYPGKAVTLLHSRTRLLPRFDEAMHSEIHQALESASVEVVLGERLDLSAVPDETPGQRTVRTDTGRKIRADLVLLCTGQRPNTGFLQELDARTVDIKTGLAHVLPTMQLGVLPSSTADASTLANDLAGMALQEGIAVGEEAETTPYPHIFVVGDAADAVGAIPAGHNADYQASVAARNILRLVGEGAEAAAKADATLESYTPGQPSIKVTLGLHKNVYQVKGVVGVCKAARDDLSAASMWGYFGHPVQDADGEELFC
ncbi:hypothetical protein C8R43DRAFT_1092784 [Mycena crocata]|nr:hypothetical protein C8R43DRAFT_1092784 [Mycena crocata]